jgi:oxygen-independent coproporphyrinogen-3 oxidase
VAGAYLQNQKKLSDYERTLGEGRLSVERGIARTPDDDVRRDVIHSLMCNFAVNIPAVEERHGIDFARYFASDLEELQEHVREGLVEVDDRRIRATPEGELLVRNLALCFDRYWREKHKDDTRPMFSRSV